MVMNSDSAFYGTLLAMLAFVCGYPYIALIVFIIGVWG